MPELCPSNSRINTFVGDRGMLRAFGCAAALTAAIVAQAQETPTLEVMDITPGVSTIADVKARLQPHTKKISCKDKHSLDAMECRTKGERDSLTLANEKVTVAFTAPLGSEDTGLVETLTVTFENKSSLTKHDDARRLVSAYTAKFGVPTTQQNCLPEERSIFTNDESASRPCAIWIDGSGAQLSVIYRVQHDVISAMGSNTPAPHFIQVEIVNTQTLVSDL